jgi:hypothetical protein
MPLQSQFQGYGSLILLGIFLVVVFLIGYFGGKK